MVDKWWWRHCCCGQVVVLAKNQPPTKTSIIAHFQWRLVVVALSTESVANIPLHLAFCAREGMCHHWWLVVVVVVVAVALSMELVADVPLRLVFCAREGMCHCWSWCWQLSASFDVSRRAKTLLATSLYLGNCTGLQNPRVLPRVFLGYRLGYRILYPRKTRTRATGMWVGAGLMAGKLDQILM